MPTGVYQRTNGPEKWLEIGRAISKAKKGKPRSEKHNLALLGRKYPTSPLKGIPQLHRRGENHHNWKGGASRIYKSLRQIVEYKKWRSDVFTRDGWKCMTCGISGVYVTAHHIESFIKIIKENNVTTVDEAVKVAELWDTSNGITLCEECHALTDNYKGRANSKTNKQ